MDDLTIQNLLTNSGLKVFGVDSDFIYFEDPSCIFPAFDTILEYAWLAIMIMLAIMLFGWGVLYIKNGVKIDTLFNNAKTIILILCILGVVKPIVNLVYGDDLFARQCEIKQVSRATVNELLETRNKKLGQSDENLLYENFSVVDTGPIYTDDVDIIDTPENPTQPEPLSEPEKQIINEESSFSGSKVSDVVSVESSNGATIYVLKNGTKIKRTGGTWSWRNNNPGNITKPMYGAVGMSGRFAVYPDEESGLRASMSLLRSKNYVSLELGQVYYRWAPKGDGNNPDAYGRFVSKKSGVPLNKKIRDINDDELMRVVRAMQIFEGWKPGIEQRI